MDNTLSRCNSVKYSFIVPVYNVEKYLQECVDSILNQDYKNFEIILVDDGSTDGSGKLCDSLANLYDNVKVIHQENKGLSEARNTGIRNANGDYILFVDSDDYIKEGILSKINNLIKNEGCVDVVFLEAIKFYPDGRKERMKDGYIRECICGKSHEEVLNHIATLSKFPGSACTKAIRREILDDSMFFVSGLISEDIEWSYRLFMRAKTYSYLPDNYYFYRQAREGSITNTLSESKIESMFWTIEKWADKNPSDNYKKLINSFASYQYMVLLFNISHLDTKTFNKYLKRAVKLKWLLKYGKSEKIKLVSLFVSLVGLRLTAILLNIYKRK